MSPIDSQRYPLRRLASSLKRMVSAAWNAPKIAREVTIPADLEASIMARQTALRANGQDLRIISLCNGPRGTVHGKNRHLRPILPAKYDDDIPGD